MRFRGNLRSFRIRLDAYRSLLHEQLSKAIAHAAAEWLEAAIADIPVWSGASQATFLKLARDISYPLRINPKVMSQINFGESRGEGELIRDIVKVVYKFTYHTNLRHLIFNEYHNANVEHDPAVFNRLLRPGPYQFQEKGREAFLKAAKEVRLPSPWKVLKHRSYHIG